ncbi:MAG: tryptophan--tRNA ligase [Acidobacteria bacterium]|nr:tryptophan--tRNA ligase [Acidobacteriota bacterium]
MIVPTPWLERVPTYKEQQQQLADRDLSTYGFLGYPLLQAADILVYKADAVPVGEDQVPHIELTREVARRFNGFYRPLFPEPQAMLSETPKVVGTDGRKMSKSYGNTIALSDSPSEVHKKVMSMMTDPQRTHRNIPGNPDVCPVYLNHQSFTNADEVAQINQACRTAAMGCVDCKKTLSASLERAMAPIYSKRKEWERRPDEVRDVLIDGSKRAGEIAKCTMTEVRKAVNIYYGRE